MVTYYKIHCNNCLVDYKIDKDITKCILCQSTDIVKEEISE